MSCQRISSRWGNTSAPQREEDCNTCLMLHQLQSLLGVWTENHQPQTHSLLSMIECNQQHLCSNGWNCYHSACYLSRLPTIYSSFINICTGKWCVLSYTFTADQYIISYLQNSLSLWSLWVFLFVSFKIVDFHLYIFFL